MQGLEIDTSLSVALRESIKQNVCCMTKNSGAKNYQRNADNGKKHDQYHEVLFIGHQANQAFCSL